LKFVASPVPEIIAIGVLGGGCEVRTPNLGEEEAIARGSEMVPFERALVVPIGPP